MFLAVIAASAAVCGKLLSFCDECGVRTSSGAERVSAKVKLKEHFIAQLILLLMLPLAKRELILYGVKLKERKNIMFKQPHHSDSLQKVH